MKKNNGMLVLLGMVIILVSIAAVLLPLGTGFVTAQGDNIIGYDFVFGNSSARINPEQGGPYGGLITAFVLGCVGGLFQIIALIFSFGQGGKKFVGFMDIVAGRHGALACEARAEGGQFGLARRLGARQRADRRCGLHRRRTGAGGQQPDNDKAQAQPRPFSWAAKKRCKRGGARAKHAGHHITARRARRRVYSRIPS